MPSVMEGNFAGRFFQRRGLAEYDFSQENIDILMKKLKRITTQQPFSPFFG